MLALILCSIIYLILGIIYPLVIMKNDLVLVTTDKPKKQIFFKLLLIFVFTIFFFLIIYPILLFYNSNMPSSTSDLCQNMGGWVYSCKGNNMVGFVSFFMIFIIIIIYYKLCEKKLYEIFAFDIGIFKYIIMVIYLLFMIMISGVLALEFSGLFISQHYSFFIEILRLITVLLPMNIFAISTYVHLAIKKIMFR